MAFKRKTTTQRFAHHPCPALAVKNALLIFDQLFFTHAQRHSRKTIPEAQPELEIR